MSKSKSLKRMSPSLHFHGFSDIVQIKKVPNGRNKTDRFESNKLDSYELSSVRLLPLPSNIN